MGATSWKLESTHRYVRCLQKHVTLITMKTYFSHIFPGEYHQNGGISHGYAFLLECNIYMFRHDFLSITVSSICLFPNAVRPTAPFWPASVVDKPRAHSWRSAIPGPNLLFSSVFVQRSRGSREPTRIYNRNIWSFSEKDYYGLPPLFENDFYGLPLQLDDDKNLMNQSTIGIYMGFS